MPLFGRRKDAEPPPPPSPEPEPGGGPGTAPTGDSALVTAYDGYGRRVQIPRAAWRTQVLPHALRSAWDRPDELAGQITTALTDGLAVDVVDAAYRLQEIDPDIERGGVLLGVSLLEVGRLDEAASALRRVTEALPRSASALTNLAKVEYRRGHEEASHELLMHALAADPNYENALMWYGAQRKDQLGDSGWVEVMAQLAKREGSWRPQLWLGRASLKDNDLHGALAWYQQALDRAPRAPDALMMATGDLGNAGYLKELLDLGLPRWDPAVHGVAAGINLAQAALQLERVQEASDVIHRLYALQAPNLPEQLLPLSQRLDELRQSQQAPASGALAPDRVRMAVVGSPTPVWWRALAKPAWATPLPRAVYSRRLAFFPLAARDVNGDGIQQQHVTWNGRLARGVPFFLAERVRRQTDATAAAIQPVVAGGGVALVGGLFPAETIRRMLEVCQIDADLCVDGWVAGTEAAPHLELRVIQPDGTELSQLSLSDAGAVSHMWSALAATLAKMSISIGPPEEAAPSEEYSVRIASANEAVFHFTLAAVGLAPAERLTGERDTLRWLLDLAVSRPAMDEPRLLLLAALVANKTYGSPIYAEFSERIKTLIAQEPPTPLFSKMRPLISVLYGEPLRPPLSEDPDYAAWIERISAGPWYGRSDQL